MRIHLTIFSYQRKDMLESLLKEIKAYSKASKHELSYIILDDGSDFTIRDKNAVQFEHMGKPGFWQIWNYALTNLPPKCDLYVFLPTDFSEVDFERMLKYVKRYGSVPHTLNKRPFVYNILNDGRTNCWNNFRPQVVDIDTLCVGFTDCGFFCNSIALDRLGRWIKPINQMRFVHNPTISSGVGQQLTDRLTKAKVPMYLPIHSLATHGNHPSTMHPDERIKNPLISK